MGKNVGHCGRLFGMPRAVSAEPSVAASRAEWQQRGWIGRWWARRAATQAAKQAAGKAHMQGRSKNTPGTEPSNGR